MMVSPRAIAGNQFEAGTIPGINKLITELSRKSQIPVEIAEDHQLLAILKISREYSLTVRRS